MRLFIKMMICVYALGMSAIVHSAPLLDTETLNSMSSDCKGSNNELACVLVQAHNSNDLSILTQYEKLSSEDSKVKNIKYSLYGYYAAKFSIENNTKLADKYFQLAIEETWLPTQKTTALDLYTEFLMKINDLQSGYRIAQQSLEINPKSSRAHLNIGKIIAINEVRFFSKAATRFNSIDSLSEAKEHLLFSYKTGEIDPVGHSFLSLIFALENDDENALIHSEFAKDRAESQMHYAFLLAKSGNYEKALSVIDDAKSKFNSQSKPLANKCEVLALQGQYSLALEACNQSLELNPKSNHLALSYRAGIKYILNDPKYISDLHKIDEIKPLLLSKIATNSLCKGDLVNAKLLLDENISMGELHQGASYYLRSIVKKMAGEDASADEQAYQRKGYRPTTFESVLYKKLLTQAVPLSK